MIKKSLNNHNKDLKIQPSEYAVKRYEFLEQLINDPKGDFWSSKSGIISFLEKEHPEKTFCDSTIDAIELLAFLVDSECYDLQKKNFKLNKIKEKNIQ